MNPSTLPAIAHLVSSYLAPTGSWIHSQITHLQLHRSIVITNETQNLDMFPFHPVYSYGAVSWISKALLCLKDRRIRGAAEPFFVQSMQRERVQLLQAHFGYMGLEALRLKKRIKIPLVTTFYGADVGQLAGGEWNQAYRRLFEEGDRFLAEGPTMRKKLIEYGCSPEKVLLQKLGVPVSGFPFQERRLTERGKVRVLIAAVFRQKKGIPYALRAIERLCETHSNIEVTIIGDSGGKRGDQEEKEKILALVTRLGAKANWLGLKPYAEYKAALYDHHIFLSPSITADDGDTEGGAPVSLIEAQASGMPVVSSTHADIPEIVQHERSGLLSPEKDLDALTNDLERVVSNPDLWPSMGRCGRAHIEANHNITWQMSSLEKIYSSLIEGKAPLYAITFLLLFGISLLSFAS